MKIIDLRLVAVAIFLTSLSPNLALAQEASTSRLELGDEVPSAPFRELDLHLNPQLGVSSFNYSGEGSSQTKLSGGATVELGGPARKFETGLLILSNGATATVGGHDVGVSTTYLAIPMLAKLRVLQMQDSSYYVKVGALTAFEMASSNRAVTSPVDVLGSLGVGARFKLMPKADFLVDVVYNRGFLDALHTSSQVSYNSGVLATIGLSFRI